MREMECTQLAKFRLVHARSITPRGDYKLEPTGDRARIGKCSVEEESLETERPVEMEGGGIART